MKSMKAWAPSGLGAPAAMESPSSQAMAPSVGITNSTGSLNVFLLRAAEPDQ